jgi:hypothetical protein
MADGDTSSTKVSSAHEPIEPSAEPPNTGSKEPEKTDPDKSKPGPDGKPQLKESDCWHRLSYSFSPTQKWSILSVIFIIQVSMNFNASVYVNAITLRSDHFKISEPAARVGQMIS